MADLLGNDDSEDLIGSDTVTSFNGRTGVVFSAVGDYALSQLSGVSIVSPQADDVLQYVNGSWSNQALSSGVFSFNGRTGAVTPQAGDYLLSQIGNVSINIPASSQALIFNGTNWANAAICNSFNSRTGAVTPQTGDYAITQLSGVSINTPASSQALIFNGTNWANAAICNSFNSRTGAVTPQTGDYAITQLSGVSINTPSAGQILQYNGSAWANVAGLTKSVVTGLTTSCSSNTFYIGYFTQSASSSPIIFTLPSAPAVNDEIVINIAASNRPIKIQLPNDAAITLNDSAKESSVGDSINLLTKIGSIHLICAAIDSATHWSVLSSCSSWSCSSGGFVGSELSNLGGVSISGPASGEVLSYDGTNFVNSSSIVNSFNGRTGAVISPEMTIQNISLGVDGSSTAVKNTIYNISGPVNYTLTLPDASGVNAGDRITVISTVSGTFTIQASAAGYFNSSGAQSSLGASITPETTSCSIELICTVQVGQVEWGVISTNTYWTASSGQIIGVKPVKSFNGRSGIVVPVSGDYSITQLSGVSLSSPASGDFFVYNGSNWINQTPVAGVISPSLTSSVTVNGATLQYEKSGNFVYCSFLADCAVPSNASPTNITFTINTLPVVPNNNFPDQFQAVGTVSSYDSTNVFSFKQGIVKSITATKTVQIVLTYTASGSVSNVDITASFMYNMN